MQAVNDLAAPLLPAAFYYKTFMWPKAAWHKLYEPFIRRAAGLGEPPTQPDPDRYAQRYAHCDVLVVGAGPAGLAAALNASAGGARVLLCDEQPEFGGSLLDEPAARVDGVLASDWITAVRRCTARAAQRDAAAAHDGVRLFPAQHARPQRAHHGALAGGRGCGQPRERLWQVRAKRVVLAAGSIERPLVFPGNDRPGVMLASAARTYLHRHGVAVGQQRGARRPGATPRTRRHSTCASPACASP